MSKSAPIIARPAGAVAKPNVPVSRLTAADCLLLVLGFGLSLVARQLFAYPEVEPGPRAEGPVLAFVVSALPGLLRLAEGVILLWPLFFAVQRLLGRRQGLTVGEWLWAFAWLGTALLLGLASWQRWGAVPEWLRGYAPYPAFAWYVVFVPSMAVIALLVWLASWFGAAPQPWTHTLGLVLVGWPVLPLAGILVLGKQPVVWGG